MAERGEVIGLDELPHHLLYRILQVGELDAVDLACLEMASYTFRAAGGIAPYRFKSMPENAAFACCHSDPLFAQFPSNLQSRLLRRCGGNWKLVLRFLQATHRAATGGFSTASSSGGNRLQVAAGKHSTFLIKRGKLFGCGANYIGILGQGSAVTDCEVPVQIQVPGELRVKQLSATHHHAAFVTYGGQIFTYGDNSSGCCGHGDFNSPVYTPSLVEALSEIPCKEVSTGLSFTAALTEGGVVYTWGSNSHGQLGHNDQVDRSRPERIKSMDDLDAVTQVATGASYTVILTRTGLLYACGSAADHCLGSDEDSDELQPCLMLFGEDGDLADSDRTVPPFITSVAAGDEHCAAIDYLGRVYTWGRGYGGALGHGNESSLYKPKVVSALRGVLAVQVATGRRKTFVLSDVGEMYVSGWMGRGSSGLVDINSPIAVSTPSKVIASRDTRVTQVKSGFYHTTALSREGRFLPFGDNDRGQLNFDPDFPQRPS